MVISLNPDQLPADLEQHCLLKIDISKYSYTILSVLCYVCYCIVSSVLSHKKFFFSCGLLIIMPGLEDIHICNQ